MKLRISVAAAALALLLVGCADEPRLPAAPACGTGEQACGTTCTSVQSDPRNCGSCGSECAADELCIEGACRATCPESQVLCDGACFDTATSPAHCGACDRACGSGELCAAGSCETSCPEGQTACDGGCHDLDRSPLHCGACGHACGAGESCTDGVCAPVCAEGESLCGGACTDLRSDRANCGGCGTSCDGDELCVEGTCTLACGGGLTACGDECVATGSDARNCGGCGNACASDETCIDGTCKTHCGPFAPTVCNGACTNTGVDPANCGGCGIACATDQVCTGGTCAASCEPALDVCDRGCTSLSHDPNNCGGCGTVCTAAPHATAVCAQGGCSRLCAPGFGDCDGDLDSSSSNGCESPINTGITSCGGCGIVCPTVPNASSACVAGTCAIGQCQPGYSDCDGDPANGCETLVSQDHDNCGSCGNGCGEMAICEQSSCRPAGAGERCGTAIPLTAGLNTVNWSAVRRDYLPLHVHCSPAFDLQGPDVVLSYTATFSGRVDFSIAKANLTTVVAVVANGSCGVLGNEIACIANFVGTSMGKSIDVQPGQTYYLYVADTTGGAAPLPQPLQVTVTEYNCGAMGPPSVVVSPPSGTTLTQTVPELQVTFGRAIDPTVGSVAVTGNLGTSRTFPLSSPSVSISSDRTSLTIQPGVFAPGEQVTVSWTGLRDGACLGAIPAPAWSFTAASAPCQPGSGGLVGWQMTRIPSGWVGLLSTVDQYVAADANPNGWVYVGTITTLYRTPKAGGMPQAVHEAAGLGTAQLGYAMLIDGQNLYTLESKTGGTDGHLFRISSDGGATWAVRDMALFPRVVGDDFRGAAVAGDRIFLITNEGTSSVATEIWSISRHATTQETAELVATFGANAWEQCFGLAVDSANYYTVCRAGPSGGWSALRIPRAGGSPVVVASGLLGNTSAQALHGSDTNGDGFFDVLYYQSDREEGQFICQPTSATPFVDRHFRFGTGTGNYGLGFDPVANTLWAYDDDTSEFVQIH